MSKPREFWLSDVRIDQTFGHIHQSIHIAVAQEPPAAEIGGQIIRVIEKSAYDLVLAREAKLVEALEAIERVNARTFLGESVRNLLASNREARK